MDFLSNQLKENILYIFLIIVLVIILIVLTNFINKWTKGQLSKRYPNERPKSINFIKILLNTLWIILGAIGISFVFINKSEYSELVKSFRLVLYIGIVSFLTIIAASSINLWFKAKINDRIESNEDPTNIKFLRYIVVIFIYVVGLLLAMVSIPGLDNFAKPALGGAGIIAVIAGIASQEAFANVISGIFIISFKPFKVGDIVKLSDGSVGQVVETNLRHTVLKDFENKMIVIPNAIINKETLVNFNLIEEKICERIEFGISYDSDIDLAKKIMREEAENHQLTLDNRSFLDKTNDKPIVHTAVINLGDSSITIRAWVWANNFSDAYKIRCDLLESIKKRFDKEGIEIPFPHRTIVYKNKPEINA